ncbi:hypothetical protein [Alkalicoccus chagannorensis]|uniref:hypothetical protein n=1 Tax=Alkalicoccus chagannorensis TaxID=427072 RepID=UPI0004791A9E|nr:hypothetical protein [Alkalicoccus chagannorensis]
MTETSGRERIMSAKEVIRRAWHWIMDQKKQVFLLSLLLLAPPLILEWVIRAGLGMPLVTGPGAGTPVWELFWTGGSEPSAVSLLWWEPLLNILAFLLWPLFVISFVLLRQERNDGVGAILRRTGQLSLQAVFSTLLVVVASMGVMAVFLLLGSPAGGIISLLLFVIGGAMLLFLLLKSSLYLGLIASGEAPPALIQSWSWIQDHTGRTALLFFLVLLVFGIGGAVLQLSVVSLLGFSLLSEAVRLGTVYLTYVAAASVYSVLFVNIYRWERGE